MGRAIQVQSRKEGEIFIKWLESRLIRNNKNVLGAELGPTGSGKSYRDLRKAELWYLHHFNKPFPTHHICFGVGTAVKLISSGKLKRGDIIIFEEAGANLGSLDFQSRIAKMMNYILQSFRSMNVAIFFNLPYLSMLNKQARMLMHYSFESAGIDFKTGMNKCKPKFHQVNQDTGKVYKKYPIVKTKYGTKKVKRFAFAMPSQYLIDAYEQKKADFLKTMTMDYSEEIEKIENKGKVAVMSYPTELEFKCYYQNTKAGVTQSDIAKENGLTRETINKYVKKVREFIQKSQNRPKSLGNEPGEVKNTPILTPNLTS